MGGKGGGGGTPQYVAPPADNSEMMATYMMKMQELMGSMMSGVMATQSRLSAATTEPPETQTAPPIDWDTKRSLLQQELTRDQEETSRRARGTAYTMQSSPLLDAEEPEVLVI